jgi:hypothetical protein
MLRRVSYVLLLLVTAHNVSPQLLSAARLMMKQRLLATPE